MERFNGRIAAATYGAGLLLLGVVVLYPMIVGRLDDATLNNIALTAQGALILVVGKGADWFMRGRVTTPTGDVPGVAPASGVEATTTMTIPQPPSDDPITVTMGPEGDRVRVAPERDTPPVRAIVP
jgi:hypothetical protein